MKKTYYLPTDGIDPETIYGNGEIVCIDEAEIRRLSREWDVDLFQQMRPATNDEVAEYGVYNS